VTILTLAKYRALTGDSTTDDAVVEAMLPVAQDVAELELGRAGLLEAGDHTETLDVWSGDSGPWAAPTAVPLADDEPLRIAPGVTRLKAQGFVGWSGYHGARPTWVARATITYSGGYDSATAPASLLLGLARVTRSLLGADPALAGVPAGAKSVTVGDASISFAAPVGGSAIPADAVALLRRYRILDADRS
jgi:hypothetical protein